MCVASPQKWELETVLERDRQRTMATANSPIALSVRLQGKQDGFVRYRIWATKPGSHEVINGACIKRRSECEEFKVSVVKF